VIGVSTAIGTRKNDRVHGECKFWRFAQELD
jgi:hypothetical protein